MTRHDYQNGGALESVLRGRDLPQSRLTESDVRAIRINRNGKTAKQLASDFGVHYRTIEKARAYETWTHI
mgnify:CR=1 FL=1